MKKPLTSLDELIWQQFEKVTQYAHKNYGWDKYDCKQVTDSLSGVAGVGFGVCSILLGYNLDKAFISSGYMAMGVALAGLGICIPYLSEKADNYYRKQEVREIIQSGATQQPSFIWTRPLAIAVGIGVAWIGMDFLEESKGMETRLLGLMMLPGAAHLEFSSASSYFRSQIMTPPSTTKPFWRTTYERIKNKFSPKPTLEPAAEPISKYSLEHHLEATNYP